MAEIEFLCLANSRKLNLRCVAGIDMATGQWIRLVDSRNQGGAIALQRVTAGPKVLEPFDIARINVSHDSPPVYQPENREFVGFCGPITPATDNPLSIHTALIERLTSRPSKFLGYRWTPKNDRIRSATVAERSSIGSLAMIRLQKVTFVNSDTRLRARFSLGNLPMDLSVTDDRPGVNHSTKTHQGDWLLVVSLGEPFNEFHYKLVATCIPA